VLKNITFVAFIMLRVFVTKAQTPVLNENTSLSEKQESIIYKNFAGEYEFMVAYTIEAGYSVLQFHKKRLEIYYAG